MSSDIISHLFNTPNDPAFNGRRDLVFVEVTDLFYWTQVVDRTPSASH